MTHPRFVYLTGTVIDLTECRHSERHSRAEHKDRLGSTSELELVGKPSEGRSELWFP